MDDETDEDKGSYAQVDSLPDELLLFIFSLLPVADLAGGIAGVCRRWRTLSRTPQLWLHVDAVYELRTTVRSEFCRLLRAAPTLRTVTIKNSILPEDVIAEVLAGCSAVRELRVAVPPRASSHALSGILRHYSLHLQELTLCVTAGSRELWDAVASMEGLRVLRLSLGEAGPDQPTGESPGCPSLQVLDLEGLSNLDRMPSYILDLLQARGGQLLDLVLPKRNPVIVNDVLLGNLSSRWTQLESLSAGYDSVPFLGGMRKLTSLRLWYELHDQDEGCFATLQTCPTFKQIRQLTLETDGCRLKFSGAVLSECTGVRALKLECVGCLDARFGQVLESAPPGVTALTLRCLMTRPDDIMQLVLRFLPKLDTLDVKECSLSATDAEKLRSDLSSCGTLIWDKWTSRPGPVPPHS